MEHHKKGEPHLADTVGIQPSKDVVGAIELVLLINALTLLAS